MLSKEARAARIERRENRHHLRLCCRLRHFYRDREAITERAFAHGDQRAFFRYMEWNVTFEINYCGRHLSRREKRAVRRKEPDWAKMRRRWQPTRSKHAV